MEKATADSGGVESEEESEIPDDPIKSKVIRHQVTALLFLLGRRGFSAGEEAARVVLQRQYGAILGDDDLMGEWEWTLYETDSDDSLVDENQRMEREMFHQMVGILHFLRQKGFITAAARIEKELRKNHAKVPALDDLVGEWEWSKY